MRTPDPKYIVNLINQIIGKGLITHIANRFDLYPTVWRLYETVGYTLEQHLDTMNSGTLAEIIEYGDTRVSVGVLPIKRREHMDRLATKDCPFSGLQFNEHNLFNGLTGRELLEKAALFTILVVIMDMTHQEEYKVDDEVLAEEKKSEELTRRHSLPRNHPLYGKPLEVK